MVLRVIFLGTNGWFASDTGQTSSVLIDIEETTILLDAGSGLFRLGSFLSPPKSVSLFLSHFHMDHIVGFHLFPVFASRIKGLTIYGQPGTEEILTRFINYPSTRPIKNYGFPTEIIELNSETSIVSSPPIKFSWAFLDHSTPCIGFRLEIAGTTITYCTDTKECSNLYQLAKNADILIAECSLFPKEVNPSWTHLNPETAAQIAHQSHVGQLILTHFDASRYFTLKHRLIAQEVAQKIFPNTTAARDLLTIDIS